MKKILFTLITFGLLTTPAVLFAQLSYTPLVGLPGMPAGTLPDFNTYVETIYAITITVAALLAVVKIVIAGVKWMTTDIVTTKGAAKKDIQGAVIGLLVVLSAVLVIEIINPDINDVSISLDRNVPPPPPPATVIVDETYVENTGIGYTWISADTAETTPGQRQAFENDCVAPNTFTSVSFPLQLRCNSPADSARVAAFTSELTTGANPFSATDAATFISQYEQYIAPFEITNSTELETIRDDYGVTDVLYAVDLFIPNPGYPADGSGRENIEYSTVERQQFEGFCNRLAEANGMNGTGANDIQAVFDRDTQTAACLRP